MACSRPCFTAGGAMPLACFYAPQWGDWRPVMARGGRRAHSGPLADLDAFARERDSSDWVVLPDSWPHDAPSWPLDDPMDPGTGAPLFRHERELVLWTKLWAQGQAPAWILDKKETAVALY